MGEELDLGEMSRTRYGCPCFCDRRIDAYGPITERFIDPD